MYCVYKLTVPNGKIYIGATGQKPEERWQNGHGYIHNERLFDDIILYGWLNIEKEILYSNLTKEEAANIEARMIWEYQSYKIRRGYNKNAGLKYGYVEKYIDHRTKMTREEYREYCKTEGYKTKCISNNARMKPVAQYNLNGDLVDTFRSIGEASRKTGVSKYGIRYCLNGKQKTCGGYRWTDI